MKFGKLMEDNQKSIDERLFLKQGPSPWQLTSASAYMDQLKKERLKRKVDSISPAPVVVDRIRYCRECGESFSLTKDEYTACTVERKAAPQHCLWCRRKIQSKTQKKNNNCRHVAPARAWC